MASFKTTQRKSSTSSNYVECIVNYTVTTDTETVTISVTNMQLHHTTGWKDSFTYTYWTSGTLQSGDAHISNTTSVTDKQYVGAATDQVLGGQSKTFKRAASAYTITLHGRMTTHSTNYDGSVDITIPALLTMTVTATNGNATYNGSAHYAKIKVDVAETTVEYGTSTSYGNSLTATNANTDYTLSSVSATNVTDSKTIYYRVTKTGYITVTGSTTITISKANISPTVTMANWAYGGTASTPSVSGNSGSGTVTYNYKLKSAADSAYSTTKPSDAGAYTIRASIATTANYNAGTATKDFNITFTATPTAYNAAYNGSAHSASIKTSAPAVIVSYGTSTSYGQSVTCTNANTNYIMSNVSYTDFTNGAKTVYYSAAKNGYTVTGSTTINITKATPTLSVTGASVNYTGSAQTLVSAASVTGNGTIYYGLGGSTTSAPSSWSTTKPTATNVGSYYIWAKSDASTNYNAVTQVYKATATIKPVMYLKFHANGGTIADSPHKHSDTQYFKLNNSIVQGCSTASGTYSDIITTINTSTTYANLWNVTSYNITRTGYSVKSGTAAFNTATNGTGIDVNQDNTAAGDTNPITTQRLNGGTQITANVTKTLYVNWKANTYTVTLNQQSGSGGTTSVTATYDAAMPAITIPTRLGYTFAGYYDATSGGTQYYTAAGASARTWNKAATTTLYARWNIITIPIHTRIDGTWKDGTVWIKIGGTWKQASVGYIRIGGVWKQIK